MDDLTLGARIEIYQKASEADGKEANLRPHLKALSQYKLRGDFFVCSSILAALILRRVGYTN